MNYGLKIDPFYKGKIKINSRRKAAHTSSLPPQLFKTIIASTLFWNSFTLVIEDKALAAQPVTIYKSGKNPGPPDANDPKKGTKKDYTFLKCMSNCKSDCQLPGQGLAKTDCVQDCQDQCCSTYEQCSFKIKTNVGTSI